MDPLMINNVIFLPSSISLLLMIGIAVVGIKEFSQGFIGRIGIVVNSLLLWQIFFPLWNNLSSLIQLYLNIGSVVAIIALLSYLSRFIGFYFSLPTQFYNFALVLYGSVSILIVIILTFTGTPILW